VLVGGSFKEPYFKQHLGLYFGRNISNKDKFMYENTAVSIGASVYGYYCNMSSEVTLIERVALSIGVKLSDGTISKIIKRNSTIPTKHTSLYKVAREEKEDDYVDIEIYQGESVYPVNCVFIGKFRICTTDTRHIYITVSIDGNGLIHVSAKDKGNDRENSLSIEVEKMDEDELDDILKKYELMAPIEKRDREIINDYYKLVGFLDVISYQLNFNRSIDFTEEQKNRIRGDIYSIVSKMYNTYVINKYGLNKGIMHKICVMNDFNIIPNEGDVDLDNYNIVLQKLNTYILDKYEIYLLHDGDEISYLEERENEDKDEWDEKEIDVGVIDAEELKLVELNELVKYLIDELDNLDLSDKGKDVLINGINEIMNKNDLNSEKINKINELSIHVSNMS
jgi:hypothetical protein